jgi:hypothetical protein
LLKVRAGKIGELLHPFPALTSVHVKPQTINSKRGAELDGSWGIPNAAGQPHVSHFKLAKLTGCLRRLQTSAPLFFAVHGLKLNMNDDVSAINSCNSSPIFHLPPHYFNK